MDESPIGGKLVRTIGRSSHFCLAPHTVWINCSYTFPQMFLSFLKTINFPGYLTLTKVSSFGQKLFGVQGSHKDIFELFSSSKFSGSNLMFKDSTVSLFHLPEGLDYRGYLGNKYVTAVESLVQKKGKKTKALRWCCIGDSEKQKCDAWDPSKKKLQCVSSSTVENCIWKIKVGEADVMSLDGGHIYTAGKCGLVPVMSEYYSTGKYYAVAVVRKTNHNITLRELAGKSTCHTGVNRTAGWNVPIGRLVQMGKISKCDIVPASNYFGPGCAPGAPLDSNLCKKCVGSGVNIVGDSDTDKCKRSSSERYSGYSGAFRCMAEGAGDVAFVKHLTVPENTDGANPAPWANNLKSSDFELLCIDGTRAPITDYLKCNLALSPAHAVFSRLEMKERVHDFLLKSQKKYGHGGSQENIFSMFSSADYVEKDLLFKDSTQCLVSIETNNYKDFLGDYFKSMEGLNACAPSGESGLIETCEFDVCHIPKKV
uniref:Transferrin-like domain-containing protein n=1 Tax=Eptatretus burgeri TaxID=7764 RepID=A0A8C4RBB5_EPTBU